MILHSWNSPGSRARNSTVPFGGQAEIVSQFLTNFKGIFASRAIIAYVLPRNCVALFRILI